MRIGVIGAGALGLYYGAMLQRSGQDVHFLLRRDFDAISRKGLHVCSVQGDFSLPQVQCYRTAAEIGPVDLVLVGLKTFSNQHLVDLVRPLVGTNTHILTLQNGLGNEELLASAFGEQAVIGGVAFLCSNRGEPGTVHHLGEGRIRLAPYGRVSSNVLGQIQQALTNAQIPCEISHDLVRIRWEKLVWNIPFNGLCALTGKTVSDLLQHGPTRELVASIMHEVIMAANRQPLREPIDAETFVARLLAFSDPMIGYRPSMMIDRLEGRALELDAIYAIPLQRAEAQGTAMPRVDMLYRCLSVGEVRPESEPSDRI
jgi:2-dehydropantoate 2-reductase